MRINPVQQNQSNFRGGMRFGETRNITEKAISLAYTMPEWCVNSRYVVDVQPMMDPFGEKDGYKAIIETVTGKFAVKEAFSDCWAAWSDAEKAEDGQTITVGNIVNRVFHDIN